MIEMAIVIKRLPQLLPWFQRRKIWCISRPTTPTISVASTSGISQSPTVTSPPPKPEVEAPSTPEILPWSSNAM